MVYLISAPLVGAIDQSDVSNLKTMFSSLGLDQTTENTTEDHGKTDKNTQLINPEENDYVTFVFLFVVDLISNFVNLKNFNTFLTSSNTTPFQ